MDALGRILATFYSRFLTYSVFPAPFEEANISCLKNSSDTVYTLDHRPTALLNSDYKFFVNIVLLRV